MKHKKVYKKKYEGNEKEILLEKACQMSLLKFRRIIHTEQTENLKIPRSESLKYKPHKFSNNVDVDKNKFLGVNQLKTSQQIIKEKNQELL